MTSVGRMYKRRALTDLSLEWGNGANKFVEGSLQAIGGWDIACRDFRGWDINDWQATRGRGCRAENAEGDGGKRREREKPHSGYEMSVVKE